MYRMPVCRFTAGALSLGENEQEEYRTKRKMYNKGYEPTPVSTCTPLGMYEGSSSEKARLRHNRLAWRFFLLHIDTYLP